MTYPPQGNDYPAQSGYPTQGYAAQGDYAAQTPYPGPAGDAENRAGRPGPPSNVGWAVASIVCFWPLAFVALTRAVDVYPLWAAGRHAEAEAASSTAKKLGIISIAILVLLFVLYFVFLFAMMGLAASTSGF